MKSPGVYMLLNILTGERYVGSSRHVRRRWAEHRWRCRRNAHQNPGLQEAWNKDGEGAFRFIILESVPDATEQPVDREQFWMDTFTAQGCVLYNVMPFAADNTGFRHTAATIAKVALANSKWVRTEAYREKCRAIKLAAGPPMPAIRAAKAKAEAQEWPPLLAPDGQVVRVTNISEFARQNGLNTSALAKVLKGRRRIHKGFSLHNAK